MFPASTAPRKPSQTPEERDLLLRLYREIGISAVAAALQIGENKPSDRRNFAGKDTDTGNGRHLAA